MTCRVSPRGSNYTGQKDLISVAVLWNRYYKYLLHSSDFISWLFPVKGHCCLFIPFQTEAAQLMRGTQMTAFEIHSPPPCCNTGQRQQDQQAPLYLVEVLGMNLIPRVHLYLISAQSPGQNTEGKGYHLTTLMSHCSTES